MTEVVETQMNLTALYRIDSSVKSIVDSAKGVAHYIYNAQNNSWDKSETDGTLFVSLRSQEPQHGFIIINRLSTCNLVEYISPEITFHLQAPFILYRKGNQGAIFGIWFHEQNDCERLWHLFTKLAYLPASYTKGYRQRCASESSPNNPSKKKQAKQNDILTLLVNAKTEYDKTHAKEQESRAPIRLTNGHTSPSVIKPKPLKPKAQTNSKESSSLPLECLFETSYAPSGNVAVKTPQKKPENLNDILKSLNKIDLSSMTNDRGRSKSANFSVPAESFIDAMTLENDLKKKLNLTSTPSRKSPPHDNSSIDNQILTPAAFKNGSQLHNNHKKELKYVPQTSFEPDAAALTLLSPMAFTSRLESPPRFPVLDLNMINGGTEYHNAVEVNSLINSKLDKNRFKEAFMHCLNDDNFLSALHLAYISNVSNNTFYA